MLENNKIFYGLIILIVIGVLVVVGKMFAKPKAEQTKAEQMGLQKAPNSANIIRIDMQNRPATLRKMEVKK